MSRSTSFAIFCVVSLLILAITGCGGTNPVKSDASPKIPLGASLTVATSGSVAQITVPRGANTASVWTSSGTSGLAIGGGTTTTPAYPITLPISGGTIGVFSSSNTSTVSTVFGN